MRVAALLALLAAGCGGAGDGGNRGATTSQIERLASPKPAEPDPRAGAGIEPLTLADLDAAGMPQAACEFSRAGALLVAASSGDAVARINGQLLHFTHSSPVEPSGGFFEDRQISISIGRIAEAAAGPDGWPARITITNRRSRAESQLGGLWRCLP